jgi:hypothetical protein
MDDPVEKIRGIQDTLLKQIKKFLVNTLPDKNLPNQNLDFLAYMHFIISSWNVISDIKSYDPPEKNKMRSVVFETKDIRNKYAHRKTDQNSPWDVLRDFDTLLRFAEVIEADENVIREIETAREMQLASMGDKRDDPDGKDNYKAGDKSLLKDNESLNKSFGIGGSTLEIQAWDPSLASKDILSVAAMKTLHIIKEQKIHSCPNKARAKETEEEFKKKYVYHKTKYMAFRNSRGEMNALYPLEKIMVINSKRSEDFKELLELAKQNFLIRGRDQERIEKYNEKNTFIKNERFFILSEEDIVDLPHEPMPQKDNLLPLYYSLSEMLSGKKVITPDLSIVS